MHAVIFLPAAQIEASEAQDWYEAEARGLGAAFRAELNHAVQRLIANPLQFPIVFADIRRALWELEERETRDAYLRDPDTADGAWPEPPWEPWTIAEPKRRAKKR